MSSLSTRHAPAFCAAPSLTVQRASHPSTTTRPTYTPPTATASPPQAAYLAALAFRAERLKCPFFRRRATDTLDAFARTLAFVASVRHKSLLPLASPRGAVVSACGTLGYLDPAARLALIREDFDRRQYYVTGRLSSGLYRGDCEFVSPDPDSNFRGVRKYCAATKGLFHRPESRVDLLRISEEDGGIVAWWRLEGVLHLPWLPRIKAYTGRTKYVFDGEGLIVRHEETWSLSFLDAFGSTLFPVIGRKFGVPEAPSKEVLVQRWKEDGEEFDAYVRRK